MVYDPSRTEGPGPRPRPHRWLEYVLGIATEVSFVLAVSLVALLIIILVKAVAS